MQRAISLVDIPYSFRLGLQPLIAANPQAFMGKFKGKVQFDEILTLVENDAAKLVALVANMETGKVTAMATAVKAIGAASARPLLARYPDGIALGTILSSPNATAVSLAKVVTLPDTALASDIAIVLGAGHIDQAITFMTHHVGSLAYGSGDHTLLPNPNPITLSYRGNKKVQITRNRLTHFQTGHTFEQFSFDNTNITRAPQSTFFPLGTTEQTILARAHGTVFSADSTLLVSAVSNDDFASTVVGNYKFGLVPKDNFLSVTQFFPTAGSSVPARVLSAIGRILNK